MTLHCETAGSGPDLVLLHGWGLHGGIFAALAAALALSCRVHRIDLPGHGRSPFAPGFDDIDGLAAAVGGLLPARCTLLGWSLGGQVALQLASRPDNRIDRLVLVATTPRFSGAPDWRHGLDPGVIEAFAADLARDYRAVLGQFLTLQARGDDRQRALIRELRTLVRAHGEPDPAALAAGLRVLRDTDLRDSLDRVDVPTLVLDGEHDRLTRPGAGEYLARHIPAARHLRLRGASHAPFLSHPDEFLVALRAFLRAGEAAPAPA